MTGIKRLLTIIALTTITATAATAATAAENYTIYNRENPNKPISPLQASNKQCDTFTSQPDYSKMQVIKMGLQWRNQPVYEYGKIVDFSDAYVSFLNYVTEAITKKCNNSDVDGAANLNIKFAVSEKAYSFAASYDFFKYK